MKHIAALIAEARARGIRLAFDGDRLCAYAADKPAADLIDRLRAARPQLHALLRAEQQLLREARRLDLLTEGRSPDPTTASTFVSACQQLREAFLEGNGNHLNAAIRVWRAALPRQPEPRLLAPQTPPQVLDELAGARTRLGQIAARLPHQQRPAWDELDPLERTRRTACEDEDVERGLRAVAAWEQAVRELLTAQPAGADLAGSGPR